MDTSIFENLADLFTKHGFRLYIIGGTARDFLLGREVCDYDFVTDATPVQMKEFLGDADYTFEKFGTVRLTYKNHKVDIVTLRVEGEYLDYRHPKNIRYVTEIKDDFCRRDFTINALYIDRDYHVHDFANGLQDLKAGVIRLIGDIDKRFKEDPLRILRAERFAHKLHFIIEPQTLAAMNKYRHLLSELNPDKVKEEENKQK